MPKLMAKRFQISGKNFWCSPPSSATQYPQTTCLRPSAERTFRKEPIFPSVQDGVFVMLSPLLAGRHVFKFKVSVT